MPVLPDKVDAPARAEPVQLYTHSFALVIGIDKYQFRAWPKLSNGVRDAEAVAKALERHGFKVTLKRDLKADELRVALEEFFIAVGSEKNARLLLWFAGHGKTISGEGYLVPADAPASSTGAAFHLKALSLRRFAEYMREAKSRHVLAVFNSCFGGTVFETTRAPPPAFIRRATTLPVRQMISSGEADQEVSDNGLFRKLFIAALEGEEPSADANGDGFLTGSELGLFLSDKVTNLMPGQTPRYGKLRALGYDRGDFVFRVGGPAKVAATPAQDEKPATAEPKQRSDAAEAWSVAERTSTIPALEAYIRRFGDTYYGDLAKARLAELKQAEAARQAAEAKKKADEDARAKAEAERQRLAMLEAKRKAEEAARRDPALSVKPGSGESFRDCDVCPEMVVVPAGSFTMGSPPSEEGRDSDEGPQRRVTIARPFAVGKFEVTFAEWDACVAAGGCKHRPERSRAGAAASGR